MRLLNVLFDFKFQKESASAGAAATGDDDFRLDLGDERFGAVFESAEFNVDPSHPNFKKTKSMQAIVDEKQKRIGGGSSKRKHPADAKATPTNQVPSCFTNLGRCITSYFYFWQIIVAKL